MPQSIKCKNISYMEKLIASGREIKIIIQSKQFCSLFIRQRLIDSYYVKNVWNSSVIEKLSFLYTNSITKSCKPFTE